MADEWKPSVIHSPNIEGRFTTFQDRSRWGWADPEASLVLNCSPGLAKPQSFSETFTCQGSSLSWTNSPRSLQALPCGLETPVGAVLASSWELFGGKKEKGPGVLCRAKVRYLARGGGNEEQEQEVCLA